MKKLRLIIFMLIFMFSLLSLKSSALDTCTGTSMCNGGFTLNCDSVSDGYCPENYGDWNSCALNAYGGKCSTICDPDCSSGCGGGSPGSETVEVTCDPAVVDPGSQVSVEVKASGADVIDDYLNISQGKVIANPTWPKYPCKTNPCKLSFNDKAPSTGGTIFYYTATTYKLWTNNGYSVTHSCLTKPLCNVNINPTRTEGSKKFISGIATVTLNVDSTSGVQKAELYFYKWNKNLKAFSPMTPPEQGCSIAQCSFVNCNKLIIPGNTYNWDTTKCENGDYSLTMTGIDNNNNSCTDTDQATIEGSVICVDQCSVFSSKIINTIIVKIKSWI